MVLWFCFLKSIYLSEIHIGEVLIFWRYILKYSWKNSISALVCFIIILGGGVYGNIYKTELAKNWSILKLGDGHIRSSVYYADYFVHVKNAS